MLRGRHGCTENDIVIEAWNTVLFDKFVRFKHLMIDGLSQHSDEAFARYPFTQGARVLDIGCGFGDSTRRIAGFVGPRGEAVGVDCAANFIKTATEEARAAGVANASFFTADVQSDDLRGPYDCAFARFGTMFFMMPGAAMRNIRKAIKPGGTLTMIVWRRREDNPWLHDAELRVRQIVPVVSHEDTDQVHCGPGPFSMSGPDMVSSMLRSAGYDRISVRAVRHRHLHRPGPGRCDRVRDGARARRRDHPSRRGGRRTVEAAGRRGASRGVDALRARERRVGAVEHVVRHGAQSVMQRRSGERALARSALHAVRDRIAAHVEVDGA